MEKKHEKIRVIASTVNGDKFVVSEANHNVQIWDINDGLVSKFSTDFVFAMPYAISISEDGKLLAIAGYNNKTVTLYNSDNGNIIWKRKDIKKAYNIKILKNHNYIFIATETQGAFFLDKITGDTIEKLKGIKYIRESVNNQFSQYEKDDSSIINNIDNKTNFKIIHKSFALLDTCFSEDKIFCSYSGNPIEAISLSTSDTIWSTEVIGHFIKIEYSKELNKILGIRWEYEKGSSKFLCYIDIKTGIVEKEIDLGRPLEISFLKEGSLILTSQGKLYSALTGTQMKQFLFEND